MTKIIVAFRNSTKAFSTSELFVDCHEQQLLHTLYVVVTKARQVKIHLWVTSY